MTTLPGTPLSALQDATGKPTPDDRILAFVGGKLAWLTIQLAQEGSVPLSGDSTIDGQIALTKAPTEDEHVVRRTDLAQALSDSNLAVYADQAATGAKQSQASAAASGINSGKAAQSASDAAAILEGTQQAQSQIEAVSAAAQNSVSGVTADANAARVLLTAAIEGNAPLTYRGYWNAATNSPALTSGVGAEGDVYRVSVAGTTNLDGNAAWSVEDAAWFHNGAWQFFARAGWAAFAQSITAAGSVTAGTNRFSAAGGGNFAQVWIDATARLLAAMSSDGSLISYGASARLAGRLLSTTQISGGGELVIGGDSSVLGNTTSARWPGVQTRPDVALSVQSRPPGRFDDVVCGYAVGDTWRHNATLYTCTKNSARGAVWSRNASGIDAPYDALFGSALLDVWSLKRAVSGYTGALIDVQIIQDGAWSAAVPIGQNGSGGLDTLALNALLAKRDSGTRAAVVRWHGQNGKADLTASPDTAPHIGETTVNGAPAVSWDTTGSGVAMSLSSTTISLPQAGWSVLTVGRYTGTNTSLGENVAMVTGGTGTANRFSTVAGLTEDGRVGLYLGSGGWVAGTKPQETSPSVGGLLWDGASAGVVHGGDVDLLAVPAGTVTGAFTGLSLGCLTHGSGDTGTPSNLVLTEAVALTGAVSAATLAAYNAAISVRHRLVPQASYELHTIGDSRTAGYINSDGYSWPAIAIEEGYLDTPPRLFNWAVSGSTTQDFIGYTQASVVAAIKTATRPVLCTIWLGVNDYGKIGYDPAAVCGRVQSIAATLLAAGAKHVFVLSEVEGPSQGVFTATFGRLAGVTLINPFSPDLSLYSTTDETLWHLDHVHPLPDCDRAIAGIVSTAINHYLEDAA
ncbi:hypothetical protein GFGA_1c0898 [Gluconobacter frateurii NBRC 103465]|nr:hypothetical protein GFGA_1c0898 [Gluconobacter frateurii NBRC 103465]